MKHFRIWLIEQGEQDYWSWMKYREYEEDGNITAVGFDYSKKDTIVTTCGRLTHED